ncbi:UNVERIFIED_CONTAM: hypothetical protein H355_012071 [Colinus virginianus]|nr:hypothetical protein H355_012071 [Colinus virginianus]
MQQELDERSRYLTDEELDCLLPKEGYEIVPPPADYNPPLSSAAAAARARQQAAASTPGVAATPTPVGITPLYTMPEEGGLSAAAAGFGGLAAAGGGGIGGQLTAEGGGVTMKAEDYQFFAKLFEEKDEGLMTQEVRSYPPRVNLTGVSHMTVSAAGMQLSMRRSELRIPFCSRTGGCCSRRVKSCVRVGPYLRVTHGTWSVFFTFNAVPLMRPVAVCGYT